MPTIECASGVPSAQEPRPKAGERANGAAGSGAEHANGGYGNDACMHPNAAVSAPKIKGHDPNFGGAPNHRQAGVPTPRTALNAAMQRSATRAAWEAEAREHRMALRQALKDHREGRGKFGDELPDYDDDEELVFEEEKVYPPLAHLTGSHPALAVQGPSGQIYWSKAFGVLRPHHFPRNLAIWIVENPVFDPIILITIMSNCVTMAWASPLDPPGTDKEALLAKLEWVYLYIFTFELCAPRPAARVRACERRTCACAPPRAPPAAHTGARMGTGVTGGRPHAPLSPH